MELQRGGIQAISQARRFRSIRENVAQVAIAAGAANLDTDHAVAIVFDIRNVFWVERLEETRPAGARFKFRRGTKQRQIAQSAVIHSRRLLLQQPPAECRFGAVVEEHPAFLGSEACREALQFFSTRRGEVVPCGRDFRHISYS